MATVATNPRGRPSSAVWRTFAEARRAKGMTQSQAAAVIGVAQQTLSDWETGEQPPHRKHWGQIANYLNIPMPDLAADIANFFTNQYR